MRLPHSGRRRSPWFAGYQGFQTTLVQIHGVGTNIRKYQTRAAQSKGVRGRDEGKRWNDHFVLRAAVEQKGRHLERMSTGCRE